MIGTQPGQYGGVFGGRRCRFTVTAPVVPSRRDRPAVDCGPGPHLDFATFFRPAADSNDDSNSSNQRLASATGDSAEHTHYFCQLGICPA